mgnify:CR=1 FL=1
MSYEKVIQAKKVVVGTKQTVKALKNGKAKEVFVAKDADPRLTEEVIRKAAENDIPVVYVSSKKKLGKACGIDVAASTVAIID